MNDSAEPTRCGVPGCRNLIPPGEEDDYLCRGCHCYVCEQHPGMPIGIHHVEDHDEDPDQ